MKRISKQQTLRPPGLQEVSEVTTSLMMSWGDVEKDTAEKRTES